MIKKRKLKILGRDSSVVPYFVLGNHDIAPKMPEIGYANPSTNVPVEKKAFS
jgi:hypothetical protein